MFLMTRTNESKETNVSCIINIYHANVKNVIPIKFGITIDVDASAKAQEKMCAKKVLFGILIDVLVKMVNI